MGRKRRMRTEDFGDDPKIRHSHGEHTQTSQAEPWEQAYFRRKRGIKVYRVTQVKGKKAKLEDGQGKSVWVSLSRLVRV